jgi:hypothetical protein
MPPVQKTTLALDFEKFDTEVINHIREEDKNIPLLTVLLSGRPMLIDNVLSTSSAVVSAFLPGTSGGEGIVNAITGKYVIRPNGQSDIKNSLSFDWPKSMVQINLLIGSIEELSILRCRWSNSKDCGSIVQSRLWFELIYRFIINPIMIMICMINQLLFNNSSKYWA